MMTTARKDIVDVDVTPWYHCISKTIRGALLPDVDGEGKRGDGGFDGKQWIDERLELLCSIFAIGLGGFAVLDNHLHLVVRLDPKVADEWSPEEVIRRWFRICPPRVVSHDNEKAVEELIVETAKDSLLVEAYRKRLKNLGWFMKMLKEPLARILNKANGCTGVFWQPRFKSIGILDLEALLATNVYVDLNVFAAGLADTPETSPHTSVNQRVENALDVGSLDDLLAARQGTVAGSAATGNIEEDFWLVPIEDRRPHTNANPSSDREGMLESVSLGSYLLLLDHCSRLFRDGKARLDAGVSDILERIGVNLEVWNERIKKMMSSKQFRGNFFAGDPAIIREHSKKTGKRRANLAPQAA